jgi:hypothetical protein
MHAKATHRTKDLALVIPGPEVRLAAIRHPPVDDELEPHLVLVPLVVYLHLDVEGEALGGGAVDAVDVPAASLAGLVVEVVVERPEDVVGVVAVEDSMNEVDAPYAAVVDRRFGF